MTVAYDGRCITVAYDGRCIASLEPIESGRYVSDQGVFYVQWVEYTGGVYYGHIAPVIETVGEEVVLWRYIG